MRIPRSAQVLIDQIGERYKTVKVEPVGDADGFGVTRSIQFAGAPAKFLAKTLPELDDPRISSVEEKGSSVIVHFVGNTRADRKDPFPLDEAEVVASEAE